MKTLSNVSNRKLVIILLIHYNLNYNTYNKIRDLFKVKLKKRQRERDEREKREKITLEYKSI